MSDERRRYPRVNTEFITWYEIKQPDLEYDYGTPVAKNLSIGGIRFDSDKYLQNGTIINLKFKLPNIVGIIKTRAIVRWTKENNGRWETGVEFITIDENDVKKIEKFVDELLKLENYNK